jgi:hypothetical protein
LKTPKWICSKCNQPFTRRWNANRHCTIKHSGRIENIISFTKHIVNSTNLQYDVRLDSFYQNNSQLLNAKPQLYNDKSIPINYPQPNILNNSLYDANANESKLLSYELLDRLAPAHEEMHRILDFIPEDNRKQIIGSILDTAIVSNNPYDYMQDILHTLRKNKRYAAMLNDLSSVYGPYKGVIKNLLISKLD